jgi:hypothetical protein
MTALEGAGQAAAFWRSPGRPIRRRLVRVQLQPVTHPRVASHERRRYELCRSLSVAARTARLGRPRRALLVRRVPASGGPGAADPAFERRLRPKRGFAIRAREWPGRGEIAVCVCWGRRRICVGETDAGAMCLRETDGGRSKPVGMCASNRWESGLPTAKWQWQRPVAIRCANWHSTRPWSWQWQWQSPPREAWGRGPAVHRQGRGTDSYKTAVRSLLRSDAP